jgi:plastocyanin
LASGSVAAGRVTFTVHNAGRVAHVIAIAGTGLATRRTPLIQPGATRTLAVTLGGGTFRVWCPVGRHAAMGMKATLKVRGAPVPAPPTTTNPDPGYGGGGDDGY